MRENQGFISMLRAAFSRGRRKKSRQNPARAKRSLRFEDLEKRTLLTVLPLVAITAEQSTTTPFSPSAQVYIGISDPATGQPLTLSDAPLNVGFWLESDAPVTDYSVTANGQPVPAVRKA